MLKKALTPIQLRLCQDYFMDYFVVITVIVSSFWMKHKIGRYYQNVQINFKLDLKRVTKFYYYFFEDANFKQFLMYRSKKITLSANLKTNFDPIQRCWLEKFGGFEWSEKIAFLLRLWRSMVQSIEDVIFQQFLVAHTNLKYKNLGWRKWILNNWILITFL